MLLYRIFSYFLLVIGILMGLSVLLAAPVAFAKPELLIEVFVLLTVVLYTFSSFIFLVKGINKGQVFKYSFRDFLIVNALASAGYVGYGLWKFFLAFSNQIEIKRMAKELTGLQQSNSMLSETIIQNSIKAGLLFSLFYIVVLATHILYTIILVKRYRNLFVKNEG